MATGHLLSNQDAAREFKALNDCTDREHKPLGFAYCPLGISARPCNFGDGSSDRDGFLSRVWEGHIVGPAGSPYEDSPLNVKIVLPEFYPNEGPIVWFTNDVFHPAVSQDGLVGHSILSGGKWPSEWPKGSTIAYALERIQQMLADPLDDDVCVYTLNEEAEHLAHNDWPKFLREAKRRKKDTLDLVRMSLNPPANPQIMANYRIDKNFGSPDASPMSPKFPAAITKHLPIDVSPGRPGDMSDDAKAYLYA
eukprot:TRINITY_DN9707_c0_g1_i4.p1 TRINITY_DN9707_c0_g1~~TRINITY_DN9707_c0_g1_i4.p1  ORF type:complete len:251 (+),score=37.62 TRINITY_DN9707_c0_g1_i4:240-992(+)